MLTDLTEMNHQEWLEADSLGGFASGTVSGIRTAATTRCCWSLPNRPRVESFWLIDHLDHAGLGHVSEIADAEPPHTPRGCPFQAWSFAELHRLDCTFLE